MFRENYFMFREMTQKMMGEALIQKNDVKYCKTMSYRVIQSDRRIVGGYYWTPCRFLAGMLLFNSLYITGDLLYHCIQAIISNKTAQI